VPEKTKLVFAPALNNNRALLYVLPICKFCEANAGHNQQLRLLKVKWGTFRQGCSPLLFYMVESENQNFKME
jgi:hypothetical protein